MLSSLQTIPTNLHDKSYVFIYPFGHDTRYSAQNPEEASFTVNNPGDGIFSPQDSLVMMYQDFSVGGAEAFEISTSVPTVTSVTGPGKLIQCNISWVITLIKTFLAYIICNGNFAFFLF